MSESLKQLITRILSTNARTAALDEVIHEFRRWAKDQDNQLTVYTAVVKQCLETAGEDGLDDATKLNTIRELLSTCYSGELLKMALDPSFEVTPVNQSEGIALPDEFDIVTG